MAEVTDQWKEINKLKAELHDVIKQMRESQAAYTELVKKCCTLATALDNAAGAMFMTVVEETEAEGTGITGKRRRSTALEEPAPLTATKVAAVAPSGGGELPPGKRGCGNCGKPGHRRTTCPEPDKKANKPMGKRACSNCGQPGHRAPTCPKKG